MSPLVALALWGWIPLGALCFAMMRPSRALCLVTIAGWLFLPVGLIDAPFVDLSKDVSIAIACLIGAFVFGRRGAHALHLRLIDVPILVWCAAPMLSSLSNDLGAYDGFSGVTARTLTWGVPYFLGRAFLSDGESAHELARAIFIGGLVYVPLCLIEIRLSPQLHMWVYGYHQHSFAQTMRGSGFRPQVFMNHGLMLGLWMCSASLIGIALWRGRVLGRVWGLPGSALVTLLCATTVMCRSLGALILLCAGVAAVFTVQRFGKLPLRVLMVLPLAYVALRAPGWWSGADAVDWVRAINEDRALSLQFRLDAETRLLAHALDEPWFGWGGFSRAFVPMSEDDPTPVISDSQWIIAIGQNGLVGLIALLLAGASPIFAWIRRSSRGRIASRDAVVGTALALCLALYMIDNMFNAMTNPIFMLVAGSLAGWRPAPAAARARRVRHVRRPARESALRLQEGT